MRNTINRVLTVAGLLGWVSGASGQGFTSGSTGAYGPLDVTANTTLDLPADGVFHCTTINIANGATLKFNRNPLNTPVYLLATGDVTISGIIDVSGQRGTTSPPLGGAGGPGGFDGGAPSAGGLPPGAGLGPGGGLGGTSTTYGSGVYGAPTSFPRAGDGAPYGTPLLVPLVGGSGGGGRESSGSGSPGGGGGGAILIASSTRISLPASGRILANGGEGNTAAGTGSGGGIRLVAQEVSGTGRLEVIGGVTYQSGGRGRVRIDSLDRAGLTLDVQPSQALSLGSLMMVFPDPLPRLDITSAADTAIAEGTASPVQVQLPFGSSPDRTVVVQARHFGASVPIRVVLTPANGTPVSYDATVDNLAANPASTTVNVTFPLNTVVQVHAWTR